VLASMRNSIDLLQLSAASAGGTAEAELSEAMAQLLARSTNKPTAVWKGFFNLAQVPVDNSTLPLNVHVTASIDPLPRNGFDEVLQDAEAIFHTICPGVDFLPEMEEVAILHGATATDDAADTTTTTAAAAASQSEATPVTEQPEATTPEQPPPTTEQLEAVSAASTSE
jgi:hypothetical protein